MQRYLAGLHRILDDANQDRGVEPVQLLDRRALVITRCSHLGDKETAQIGVRHENLKMPENESFESCREQSVLEDLGLEIEEDSFVEFLENFVQQLPLIAEIPINQTIRDLRSA